MMLLDVGNSTVKWALQKNGVLENGGQFFHPGEEFPGLAAREWGGLPDPAAIAVANVAGAGMEHTITGWTQAHWHITPCYIRVSDKAAGVTNGYAEPGDLGVDRWAAIVAAHNERDGSVCIIDCGTAITVDVVAASGAHRGGLIAPGIEMMKRSLLKDTSGIRLKRVEDSQPAPLLARGTVDAVNSGAITMASAMIDRVMTDIVAECGENIEFLMTGGDAGRILSLLGRQPRHDPDLVLKGVAILARETPCAT